MRPAEEKRVLDALSSARALLDGMREDVLEALARDDQPSRGDEADAVHQRVRRLCRNALAIEEACSLTARMAQSLARPGRHVEGPAERGKIDISPAG